MSDDCHEPLRCPCCSEMTTRHDPCCPGTPQCDCEECDACGALAPEVTGGLCVACQRVEALKPWSVL